MKKIVFVRIRYFYFHLCLSVLLRHSCQVLWALSMAASTSATPKSATVATSWLLKGLVTLKEAPLALSRHSPPTKPWLLRNIGIVSVIRILELSTGLSEILQYPWDLEIGMIVHKDHNA